jgi:hypothetical protein
MKGIILGHYNLHFDIIWWNKFAQNSPHQPFHHNSTPFIMLVKHLNSPFLFPSSIHEHFWNLHTFMFKNSLELSHQVDVPFMFSHKVSSPSHPCTPFMFAWFFFSLNTFTLHTHALMLINFENKHNFELGISFEHWVFHMKMKT